MSAKYINPKLPSMIRNLHKGDPSMNSVKTMLGLAADLVQELIDLRAEQGETQWEYGSEGADGTEDPDPRPLSDDSPYWPVKLLGVREPNAEQAAQIVAKWNEGDPGSARLIRRRKAGPWQEVEQ